jgi:hypothetical protein
MTCNLRAFGGKVATVAAYFTLWWATYTATNGYGATSDRAFSFTPPTQVNPGLLQPWTAVVYVVGGSVLPLLAFCYNWTWPKLSRVLIAYAVTSALRVRLLPDLACAHRPATVRRAGSRAVADARGHCG